MFLTIFFFFFFVKYWKESNKERLDQSPNLITVNQCTLYICITSMVTFLSRLWSACMYTVDAYFELWFISYFYVTIKFWCRRRLCYLLSTVLVGLNIEGLCSSLCISQKKSTSQVFLGTSLLSTLNYLHIFLFLCS